MNKIIKKIIGFSTTTLLAAVVTISASATEITGSSLGHKNDKFQYGVQYNWLLSASQYSNFYCKDKYHSATAVVVVGNSRDQVKKTANKEKWAKAQTKYYSSRDQWNSYYNHPDGL